MDISPPHLPDPALTQQRLTMLVALRSDVARLMSSAQHDSLKAEVRLAGQDLEEASHHLSQATAESPPYILRLVDLTLQLAAHRLKVVDQALRAHGPWEILRA